MTTPQIRKKKLQLRVGFEIETKRYGTPASSAPGPSHSTAPSTYPSPSPAPELSVFEDFTFEDYKAANLNVDQKYDLIGKLRQEVPLVDRNEIDSMLLVDAAKQLEMCVFPMCKMMHVNPKAVRSMLDEQFRKAYGLEVEEEVFGLALARRIISVKHANRVNVGDDASAQETGVDVDNFEPALAATPPAEPAKKETKITQRDTAQKVIVEEAAVADTIARMLSAIGDHSTNGATNGADATLSTERGKRGIKPAQTIAAQQSNLIEISFASASAWEPFTPDATVTLSRGLMNKKTKQAQPSSVKKDVKVYEAKKKRGKKGCLIVTLRAKAVVDKWAALTTGD
jgi:hypothetical protein